MRVEDLASEQEFRAQLDESRRGGIDHLTKCGTINIPVHGLRSEKLCVIEQVEPFEPKLQGFRFSQAHVLEQSHVEVTHSRAVEKAPLGAARRAQSVQAELGGIEIVLPVAGIVIQIEIAGIEIGLIHTEVVDAIGLGAKQRVIAEVDKRHRQSSAETDDPGELPPLGPAIRGPQERFDGELVVVAHDEIVLHVKSR